MNIQQQRFLDVLGRESTRFTIPVFQRVYSWNARQCEELWDDVLKAGKDEESHFMGMLLYSRDADSAHGDEVLNVIDGQQRMTTLMLLLVAFRGWLVNMSATRSMPASIPSADEIASRYLVAGKDAHATCKLSLSSMDNQTLAALVGTEDPSDEMAERLMDNCLVFSKKMAQPSFDPALFWRGLNELEVASVLLEPDDSPQLVFESLNSKGMPLSTADRIRNYLIVSTKEEELERVYEQRWLPLEERVENAADVSASLTDVVHAWLAARYRSVRIFDPGDVYGLFKTRLQDEFGGSLEHALDALAQYCDNYLADGELRAKADEAASEWIAGKPEKSVSEYKMFGD